MAGRLTLRIGISFSPFISETLSGSSCREAEGKNDGNVEVGAKLNTPFLRIPVLGLPRGDEAASDGGGFVFEPLEAEFVSLRHEA